MTNMYKVIRNLYQDELCGTINIKNFLYFIKYSLNCVELYGIYFHRERIYGRGIRISADPWLIFIEKIDFLKTS